MRSGILISVHAFAVDPKRGLYVLAFLALVIGSALSLFAWRGRSVLSTHRLALLSRETLILSNNVVLVNRNLVLEEYWMEYVERVAQRPLRWWDVVAQQRAWLRDFVIPPLQNQTTTTTVVLASTAAG